MKIKGYFKENKLYEYDLRETFNIYRNYGYYTSELTRLNKWSLNIVYET